MKELAKLVTIDPKDVWPHEAHDFTPWLLLHADMLAEVLGIDLELTGNEYPVGSFALDLIGRDLTNDCPLVVENQLTSTDHGHLGQIITYSAGTDAQTIVWMAKSFREEHRQALDWLNQLAQGNARFFGVEIGAVKIADSPAAPLFRLRAQPNDWHSEVAAAAKASSSSTGKGMLYIGFWSRFIDRVQKEHPGWTNAHKAGYANWLSMPAPFRGGPVFTSSFAAGGNLRHELYIDSTDPLYVERLYEYLEARRSEIERAYGGPLVWEPMPDRRACRVADYRENGDVGDLARYDEYIDWFFDTGARLRQALGGPAREWADSQR